MLSEKDLQDLNTAATLIISIIERHNVRDEDAAERRALFRLFTNETPPDVGDADGEECGFVEFTEKEISKMPKIIRSLIIIKKRRCRIRYRKNGNSKNSYSYEIRFRSDGYSVTACGKTKELAKQNFLEKLEKSKPNERDRDERAVIPTTFSAFALYYFENFRKLKVAPKTYRTDENRLRNHILPHFGETPLTKVTPTTCKSLLDRLEAEGKGKTLDEIHSLMNGIFKCAIAHGFLKENPLTLIVHTEHERESGVALLREEETLLFERMTEPLYILGAAIILYTGLRPNELETARIDGEFIVAVNSKRKSKKVEYKKIPIIDRLRPYVLNGIDKLPKVNLLRRRIKAALPNHKLYDLRTTFYTRCDEMNVEPPARNAFVGHSEGKLTKAYRDLPDSYLLAEGKKLNAW